MDALTELGFIEPAEEKADEEIPDKFLKVAQSNRQRVAWEDHMENNGGKFRAHSAVGPPRWAIEYAGQNKHEHAITFEVSSEGVEEVQCHECGRDLSRWDARATCKVCSTTVCLSCRGKCVTELESNAKNAFMSSLAVVPSSEHQISVYDTTPSSIQMPDDGRCIDGASELKPTTLCCFYRDDWDKVLHVLKAKSTSKNWSERKWIERFLQTQGHYLRSLRGNQFGEAVKAAHDMMNKGLLPDCSRDLNPKNAKSVLIHRCRKVCDQIVSYEMTDSQFHDEVKRLRQVLGTDGDVECQVCDKKCQPGFFWQLATRGWHPIMEQVDCERRSQFDRKALGT